MKYLFLRVLLISLIVALISGTVIIDMPVQAAGTWTSTYTSTYRLYGVWGSSATNVFAVGNPTSSSTGGVILNYTGSSWSPMSISSANPGNSHIYGVWGTSNNDVFAVGNGSVIMHYTSTGGWSNQRYTASGTLIGVWGSSPTNVFTVGSGGQILRSTNGTAWSAMTSTTSYALQSIWGTSGSDIYAVGESGTIVHYNGTAWSTMTSGTTNDLNSVWGSSASDVYTVSSAGTILHYDGSIWSDITSTANSVPAGLYAIWGNSASDIFAVGTSIRHYNGTDWSTMSASISVPPLLGVWGSSAGDVFAVGYGGYAMHYTASTDATLSSLGVSADSLSPSFASAITTYTDNVANDITSIKVTPTVSESHATIMVNGNAVTSGNASGDINLNVGANPINIVVTAQDGITTKTYNISVIRAAPPALSIKTSLLRSGIVGTAYSQTLAATNTTGNYQWSSVGVLPANLSINASTGELHGTPSPAGTYSLTIQLNDDVSSVSRVFSIQILASGNLYSWGYNAYGQLGNGESGTGGNTKDQYTPQSVHNTTNIVALASGYRHNLALDSQGNVWAWGDNSLGQLGADPASTTVGSMHFRSEPATISGFTMPVVAIATGFNHNLAIDTAGNVWAWGQNNDGQLGISNTTSYRYTPAIVNGIGGPATSIAASMHHSLAADSSGHAWGWGDNSLGELGNGADTVANQYTPVEVRNSGNTDYLNNITNVAAGYYFSLALDSTGGIWAWGSNSNKQLGQSGASSSLPIGVSLGNGIVASTIAANYSQGLAIADGQVYVWGWNNYPPNTQLNMPAAVSNLSNVTAISADNNHNLALKSDGTIWGWGYNECGELGKAPYSFNGGQNNYTGSVTQVGTISGASAIMAGGESSMAIIAPPSTDATLINLTFSSGTLTPPFASGTTTYTASLANAVSSVTVTPTVNENHATVTVNGGNPSVPINLNVGMNTINVVVTAQDGTTSKTYTITVTRALPPPLSMTTFALKPGIVDAPYSQTLAAAGGTGNYQWYSVGALPANLSIDASTGELHGITSPAGTYSFTIQLSDGVNNVNRVLSIQIRPSGDLYAWGDGINGQIGDGGHFTRFMPTKVSQTSGLTSAVSIATGNYHALALKPDGTVWAWGSNALGQLGNNTTNDSFVPIQVKGPGGAGNLTDIIQVAAGVNYSLALKSDGSVWTWGYNSSGQLGNGTTTDSHSPVQVNGLSGVVSLTACGFHNLAVKSDGSVWAWGQNYHGELGIGTTVIAVSPVQVSGLSGIVGVGAGSYHSFAVDASGAVYAWGWNNGYGQLYTIPVFGDPENILTPVATGITSLTSAGSLTGGYGFSAAVLSDATVLTSGWNNAGQLGKGTADSNGAEIVHIANLSQVKTVSGGNGFCLAMTSNGNVWAWGANTMGQLGNGTTSDNIPTAFQVSSLSGVSAIATGGDFSLAIGTFISSDAALSGLSISAGTLTPVFSSAVITYTDSVANAVSSVSVTPIVNESHASVKVNDVATTSGSSSGDISLNVGDNTVTVLVTAQDGTTTKPYTITVTRAVPPPPLIISTASLPDGETGVAYNAPLAVTNGFSPYTWSIVAGVLPNGLLDPPVANAIAGTPSAAGTFNFTLHCVDSIVAASSKDLSITIYPGLSITTASTLPPGQAHMAYNQTLAYSGGHGAVTWSKISGSLPGTITLDPATGTLSGTPSEAGTFNFTVKALDAITNVTRDMSIIVGGPVINTAILPDGEAGVVYVGTTLTASGGVGAYTWSVDSSSPNNLPSTLVIDPATGTISGTPGTATGGPIFITFKAVDNVGAVATQSLSLTIKDAVSISTNSLPGGRIGVVYNQSLAAFGGASPYSWAKTSGDLGALNLDSAGNINGTPSASGTLTFTAGVTDALGGQAIQSLTITIAATDATLSTLTISAGTLTPVFASGTITYSENVTYAVTSLTVTPTVNESHATVTVNGNAVASGASSGVINLNVGANTITLVVMAQDTITTKTYTITATRLSNDATLSNLTISSGTLTPSFTSGTIAYTDSVANTVTSVTVTPTANESQAIVKVNGNTVISGSPSGTISLSVGDNTITIVVTAQDITTQKTYTVIVNRANFSSPAVTTNNATRRPQTTGVASVETVQAGSIASVTGTVGGLAGVQSQDGNAIASVAAGTTARTRDGLPLTTITVTPMANPPAPPVGSNIVGIVYEFGPSEATFNPPITLTLRYDPNKIPSSVPETSLVMAFYNPISGQWIPLANCVVNSGTHTVSAPVSHFTTFAVIPSAPVITNSPAPGAAPTALVPSQISPGKPASSQSASPTESNSQSTTATSPWNYVMIVILVVLAVLVAFAIIQRVRKTKT